jgi:MEMO1 family protein
MPLPLRPQLRPLELLPVGENKELLFVLRDPQGFAPSVVVPYGAAVLALFMDGQRTLRQIQEAFHEQTGVQVPLVNLEEIIRRLDEAYLLAGDRFERHRLQLMENYLGNPVRPAAHAGGAYAEDPQALRAQLAETFTADGGPGLIEASRPTEKNICPPGNKILRGILSPHIDLHRGGPSFARAYKEIALHGDADLFVIFGTCHNPMRQLLCVSRKGFDTPLGIVRTDQGFIDRLAAELSSSVAGRQIDLFADEWEHRGEHSIEFQTVYLQYVLEGKREFRIVPILVGSFHEFIAQDCMPEQSPEVQAFVAAMRAAAADRKGNVCFISGADLAHIGRRYGDEHLLEQKHLSEQADDDRTLLDAVCRNDAEGLFRHVAARKDRSRICGLAPTYMMLSVMDSAGGKLLKYDQAVEPDGTSCVSFASVAFYR